MYTGLVGVNLDSQLNGAWKGPEKYRTDGLLHTKCVKIWCVMMKNEGKRSRKISNGIINRWDAPCCSGMWNSFVSVRSGLLVELVVLE